MEPRTLITGGSGFIGTNLAEVLEARGHALLNLDPAPPLNAAQRRFWKTGNIMDRPGLERAFAEFRPDYVVHLAARCDCDEDTTVEEGYRANTEGTANVLAAVKATPGIRRAIVTSSQFVYNRGARLPAHDEDYHPVTVYGKSKIITESLTRQAGLSCSWTLIRPTNVWGPFHIRHTRQFFRVLRWGLYVHPGREPVMRSYAYVGNVVEQIARILEAEEAKVGGKTLYLGDPPLDILDWVNGFSRALRGKDVTVIPRGLLRAGARAGDLISAATGRQFFITSSRFRSMTDPYLTPMDRTFVALGPNKYSLEDGIRETVRWLKTWGNGSEVR